MTSIPTRIARILLGLVFFVFGLNGFLHFIEEPEAPEKAGAFLTALVDSGYLMTMVKAIETVCGALLLAGLCMPLALVLLAPIIVNIAAFHLFLDPAPQGLVTVFVVLALYSFLVSRFWDVYRPLLVVRVNNQNNDPAAPAASQAD